MTFIQALMESPFFQVLLAPILEMLRNAHNVFIIRDDVTRSSIRLVGTVSSFITGVVLTYTVMPGLGKIFVSGWADLGAPSYALVPLSGYSGGWIISYPFSWGLNQGIRAITKCLFDDPDYFLTTREVNALAEKIRSDSDEKSFNMARDKIRSVFCYCINNLRSSESSIGARNEDYENILEGLKKGDLGLYYTQRKMMMAKEVESRLCIEKTKKEIQKWKKILGDMNSKEHTVISVGEKKPEALHKAKAEFNQQDVTNLQLPTEQRLSSKSPDLKEVMSTDIKKTTIHNPNQNLNPSQHPSQNQNQTLLSEGTPLLKDKLEALKKPKLNISEYDQVTTQDKQVVIESTIGSTIGTAELNAQEDVKEVEDESSSDSDHELLNNDFNKQHMLPQWHEEVLKAKKIRKDKNYTVPDIDNIINNLQLELKRHERSLQIE